MIGAGDALGPDLLGNRPAELTSLFLLRIPPDFTLILGLARHNNGCMKSKISFITGGVGSSLGNGLRFLPRGPA
jgi:hypothetical protein